MNSEKLQGTIAAIREVTERLPDVAAHSMLRELSAKLNMISSAAAEELAKAIFAEVIVAADGENDDKLHFVDRLQREVQSLLDNLSLRLSAQHTS